MAEKRAPGRPTVLTPELTTKICDVVRAGNYIEVAAAYAGVSKQTLYNWMRRGRNQKAGLFRSFVDSLEKALAAGEVRDSAIVAEAAKVHWQAAAWRLERRFPKKWGRMVAFADRPSEEPPDQLFDFTKLSSEEAATFKALARKAKKQ